MVIGRVQVQRVVCQLGVVMWTGRNAEGGDVARLANKQLPGEIYGSHVYVEFYCSHC